MGETILCILTAAGFPLAIAYELIVAPQCHGRHCASISEVE